MKESCRQPSVCVSAASSPISEEYILIKGLVLRVHVNCGFVINNQPRLHIAMEKCVHLNVANGLMYFLNGLTVDMALTIPLVI